MVETSVTMETITLQSDWELRFEVEGKSDTAVLELKSGTAEIFGSELIKGKTYTFRNGAKIAVFTYQGCTLELKAKKNSSYVAKETPMMFYLNCHCCLEQLRTKADQTSTRGPVAMIVGSTDVGKSTLCRILLNYAVRMSGLMWRPMYVDLDVGQGQISIPGTIGAMMMEHPTPVEGIVSAAPLVYNFGHTNIQDNSVLYNSLVSKMAQVVREKMNNNKKVNASGILINTCGWIKGKGYQHLTHIAKTFEVDIILVLDQERLYNELVRDMPSFVKVVLVPKSGGVVEKSRKTRQDGRDARIQEYFYGMLEMPIQPNSFDVKFSEVKIVRIGTPSLPDSCLPLGVKSNDYSTKVVSVQPASSILHHILAVTFAPSPDDSVVHSNVAGFVCVTNVNMDKQTLTILSPHPKPLPNSVLLFSSLQFIDTQ